MNLLNSSRFVSRSLIGAVGLAASAMALLGVPDAAKAQDISAGLDFLETPPDSVIDLSEFGLGEITLKGAPIGPGNTDTIVARLEDCTFISGMCEVDIQIQALSLVNVNPQDPEIFVMLDPNLTQEIGSMTINEDLTWSAFLPVNSIVKDANGSLLSSDFDILEGSGTWSPTQFATINPGAGFFPTGELIGSLTNVPPKRHGVVPATTPEPSATATLALFGLAGLWSLKKKQSLK